MKRAVVLYVHQDDRDIWTPPLAGPLLGGVLQRAGFAVTLVDSRRPGTIVQADDGHILDAVVGADPQVIAVSFMSSAAARAGRLAAALRARLPDVGLIAGGAHPTAAGPGPHTAAFDVVVRGEAEGCLAELAHALVDQGRPAAQQIRRAPPADLSRSAPVFPHRWAPYADLFGPDHAHRTAYVQLARGCPFTCTFCEIGNKANFSARRRARPVGVVVDEVAAAHTDYGADFFLCVDSIATVAPTFAAAIPAMADAVAPGCTLSVNSALPVFGAKHARILEAWPGPVTVWFGMETASEPLGRRVLGSKFVAPDRVREVVGLCHDHGIRVGLNCIFGFAEESDADVATTVDLVEALGVAFPNPNLLSPLPGTAIYADYRRRDLLRDPADLSIWSADRIRAAGHGPVHAVDYARALGAYDRLLAAGTDIR